MHFEINVARAGQHLFATHERSLKDEFALFSLLALFAQKFPRREGFEISATRHDPCTTQVNINRTATKRS